MEILFWSERVQLWITWNSKMEHSYRRESAKLILTVFFFFFFCEKWSAKTLFFLIYVTIYFLHKKFLAILSNGKNFRFFFWSLNKLSVLFFFFFFENHNFSKINWCVKFIRLHFEPRFIYTLLNLII